MSIRDKGMGVSGELADVMSSSFTANGSAK